MELKGSNIDSSGLGLEYVIDVMFNLYNENFLYSFKTDAIIQKQIQPNRCSSHENILHLNFIFIQ